MISPCPKIYVQVVAVHFIISISMWNFLCINHYSTFIHKLSLFVFIVEENLSIYTQTFMDDDPVPSLYLMDWSNSMIHDFLSPICFSIFASFWTVQHDIGIPDLVSTQSLIRLPTICDTLIHIPSSWGAKPTFLWDKPSNITQNIGIQWCLMWWQLQNTGVPWPCNILIWL